MTAAEFFEQYEGPGVGMAFFDEMFQLMEAYRDHCDRWRQFPEEKPEERGWYLCSTVDTRHEKSTVVFAWEPTFKAWNYGFYELCRVTHWKPINPPK